MSKGGERRDPLARVRRKARALLDDPAVRSLARGGFWAVAIKSSGAALSLVMMAALARAMTPEDYGRFAFGFSLAMLGSVIAGLGLQVGILRWRPEFEVKGAPRMAAAVERWGLNMTLAASAALAALLAGGAGALAAAAPETARLVLRGADPAVIAGAAALLLPLSVSVYAASVLRARGAMVWALLPRDVAWRAAVSAAALAVAAFGASLDAPAALWLAAALLALATAVQALARGLRPGPQDGGGAPAFGVSGPARSWMRQATPMWGSSVLVAVQRNFEVVLIGVFLAPAVTGLYFAALSSAQIISLMLLASNMVAGPLIARAFHGGDMAGLQRILRLVMLGVAGPTALGLAVLWIWGAEILSLFDPAFATGAPLLMLLAMGTAATAMMGPAALVLILADQERKHLRIISTVVVSVAALQIIAIPLLGVWAAAALNVAGATLLGAWARQACVARIGVDPTIFCLLPRARRAPGR